MVEVSIKLLLHISLFYALFAHFHGEESAGGGFQAGAIIASVLFARQMAFGEGGKSLMSDSLLNGFLFLGLMLYFGFGALTVVLGGGFLDFGVFQNFGLSFAASQKLGIFTVEAGVLVVVSAGLLRIGFAFKNIFDKIAQ